MANQITIQPGQTLGGLASQYGTTVQNLQALNPNITNPNLIIAGQSLNIPTLNGSPVIDTNVLGSNATQPQLPPQAPTQSPQAFVAGLTPITSPTLGAINPAAQGAVRAATGQVGTLEGQRGQLLNRLAQAQQQLMGKGQEQLRLEQEAGISTKVSEIGALNEQIAAKKAAFDQAQENFRSGQVGTQELSTGKIAQVQRNQAIVLGGLSALALAKQGSLEAAKAEIDRTLALEFEPIKQEIENTKTFIDLNYQDLSRAEKKQADALQIQLRREERAVDFLNSIKKSAYDQIIRNGGTPDQITKLMNAKSAAEVVKAFGTGLVSQATQTLPSGKPDIVGALSNTIKLSGETVPGAARVIGVLSSVQKLAGANAEGIFKGLAPVKLAGRLRGQESRQELFSNRADISGIKSAVAMWVSGATLTKQQEADVLKLVPDKNDTDFAVRSKLNNLTDFFQQQARSELATKGVNYTPIAVDWFATPVDNYISNAVPEVTDPYGGYLNSLYGMQ